VLNASCLQTSPEERTMCIIPNRELNTFLSEIPDSVPLSACLLPGAFYAPFNRRLMDISPFQVPMKGIFTSLV
jgi:hypothetical protein